MHLNSIIYYNFNLIINIYFWIIYLAIKKKSAF